jgi:DNA replication licensing factor MCM7
MGFRHQIHILLIGDFNIGKSSFLKMVSTLLPKAGYINSLGSILNTSFTSKINKDPNFFFPGVSESIIFDEDIIFIDNVFFLKEKEYFKIEEILDSQSNFTGKFSPKITVIASTKKFEHFEIQKKTKKTCEKKSEFLQKFDLVFIKENGLSYSQNQKISNYLLENFGKKNDILQNKNSIDENVLRAFFSESEHIYPKFTKISIEMVIYNYVLLKTGDVEIFRVNLNIKHLISIIRLSMALAKLNFRNIISINDTKEASRLLISSIMSMKNFKLSEINYTSMSNENNIYNLIRKTSIRLKTSILSLLYLSKLSFSMGFSGEDFAKCLETYENLNVWAISLKQMKLVFLL